ncbi:MAG TPA: radical SAM protein [Polyangiaceae bacterium]|jgi:radical SAM superfamily enzyme YgiQ (UPF0313 family)|nr:radical SAM protein [Polyangiaceae bacterium]
MKLNVVAAKNEHEFAFERDPRIVDPSSFHIVFVILLDGDLVMSPEHLGVALMTAVLRRGGYTVRVREAEHGEHERVLAEIARERPAVVCFTLMSLNVASCTSFSARLKELLPSVTIVCGGPAGTYSGEQLLATNENIDIVAVGEGEPTIFELIERLYLREPLDGCRGLCFRNPQGEIVRTPLRPLMHNLDALPFPARDQLEMHDGKLEYVRLSTSRGCVARCTFCSAPHVGNKLQKGKAWRGRSVGSIVDELTQLVERYNFRTYDFIDSTFEDPDGGRIGKGRIAEIAQGILDRKLDIYYNCCMRAENWSEQDRDLLDLLVRSGLEKVNVGIESGTEDELRLWEKRATVEDNIRIIRLLREHGLYLAMGFIQFHPYSTVDSLRNNANFLRQHSGHNLRRLTERLEIYPGTPLIKNLEADGLLGEKYWREFDHYDYRYRDEAVARLALHFASMYNNQDYHERGVITEQSAVFAFETFNVVVSTFCSRLYKRFHALPGAREVLADLKDELTRVRMRLAEFNYSFFMQNLEDVLSDKLDSDKRRRQIAELERVFGGSMHEIRTLQLVAGRKLGRLGANVQEISSVMEPAPRLTKTYTGGGTPCW